MPDHGGFAWDGPVLDALDAIAPVSSEEVHPDPVLSAIVALGTAGAALLALLFLLRRQWRPALFVVGSLAGTFALSSLAKAVVARPSIEGGQGDSFPSGTAAWAAALTAACVILAPPRLRLRVAAAGGVLVLLYSAVITWEEWHYATDVVAGWALALGWVALLAAVLLRDDRGQERSVAAESGAGPWGRARPSKSVPSE